MNLNLGLVFGDDDSPKKEKKSNINFLEKKGLSRKNKKKSKTEKTNKKKKHLIFFEEYYLNLKIIDQLDKKEINKQLDDFINEIYKKKFDFGNKLIEENDFGNIEYKLKLIDHSFDRMQHLSSQMKFRLDEGFGEAYYNLGYEDNGNPLGLNFEEMSDSLKSLCYLSNQNKADIIVNRIKEGEKGKLLQIMVRRRLKDSLKLELRILMIGSYEAGKSTLLGVLISGIKDNGNGLARMNVLNHKHEVLTGVTSSLTYNNIFFDSEGNISNKNNKIFNSWENIIDNSSKIITFIDIGGHKKYQKTLIHGCLSTFPDYSMVVLNALKENDIDEQIKIAFALQTKFFIVITHIDMVNFSEMTIFLKKVRQKFNDNEDYIPIIIRDMEDCVFLSKFLDENIIPIFVVSNVTSINMDLLKYFLNLIPVNNESQNNKNLKTEVLIQNKFENEKNIILSGTVIKGNLRKKQILNLGPDNDGNFHLVEILSIHCYKISVRSVDCGQTCSFAIRFLNEKFDIGFIKRGTILIESKNKPIANKIIKVKMYDYGIGNDVELNLNYEPVVYSQTFRQSCEIINHSIEKKVYYRKKSESFYIHNLEDEQKIIRKLSNKSNNSGEKIKKKIIFKTNSMNIMILKFKFQPEFIVIGQKIIIHDDLIKAVGHVIDIE